MNRADSALQTSPGDNSRREKQPHPKRMAGCFFCVEKWRESGPEGGPCKIAYFFAKASYVSPSSDISTYFLERQYLLWKKIVNLPIKILHAEAAKKYTFLQTGSALARKELGSGYPARPVNLPKQGSCMEEFLGGLYLRGEGDTAIWPPARCAQARAE